MLELSRNSTNYQFLSIYYNKYNLQDNAVKNANNDFHLEERTEFTCAEKYVIIFLEISE